MVVSILSIHGPTGSLHVFTRMKICPIFLELMQNIETSEDFFSLRTMKVSDFPEKKKSLLLTNMKKRERNCLVPFKSFGEDGLKQMCVPLTQ